MPLKLPQLEAGDMMSFTVKLGSATEDRKRRVLVLGSAPHSKEVTAYLWQQVPPHLAIANFDTVVVDVDALTEAWPPGGQTPGWLPQSRAFAALFCAPGSHAIVIGTPPARPDLQAVISGWFPLLPHHRDEELEFVDSVEQAWAFYFDLVRRWGFNWSPEIALERIPSTAAYVGSAGLTRSHTCLYPDLIPAAKTRFGRLVAFSILYGLATADERGRVVPSGGPAGLLTWLPPPTNVSTHEAIDAILQHRCDIALRSVRPPWTADFLLPQIKSARVSSEVALDAVERAAAEAEDAAMNVEEEERFLALLYAKDEELEDVVTRTLEILGGTVHPPTGKGVEDGFVESPDGRRGVLEIKGASGAIKQEHVRQCSHWVDNSLERGDGRVHSGMLIGNPWRTRPPSERRDFLGSKASARFAQVKGLRCISSLDLFEALRRHQDGTLDREAFWNAVFAADPIFEPPWEK